MPVLVHFLLVYSYSEQRLMENEPFTDAAAASAAYRAAEERYRGRSDQFEVVLVGADSIDTIKRTHGHYFLESSDSVGFGDLVTETVTDRV